MTHQMSLLGPAPAEPLFPLDATPGRTAVGYSLFLAIVPEDDDARHIASVAADLYARHRLNGASVPPERLHITLHEVVCSRPLLQRDVDAAVVAASSVACPPIPIVFEQAGSFRRGAHADKSPVVLRGDARGDAGIAGLRQSLAVALRRAGLRVKPSSTPHMTLHYGARFVDAHPIAPLAWTATRVALIVSHVGAGHHQGVRRWRLSSDGNVVPCD